MTRSGFAFCLAIMALTSGCVSTQVDEIGPSFAAVKAIREANIAPVALGPFTATANDRKVSIRGSTMGPPKGSSFAAYLRDTVQAQLVASGRYDPASPTVITAALTENRSGENLSQGNAVIAATFTITRVGRSSFARDYRATAEWKSNFIGAIAIPEAFKQYNALYDQLVQRAFADPDFIEALTAP